MIESLITAALLTAILIGAPGPAPIALAASGASFGIKNSTQFFTGILTALLVVMIAVFFGINLILKSYPTLTFGLQIIGAAYLVLVAYKIASMRIDRSHESIPNFRDGFILNLFNPKAYAAFFAVFSQLNIQGASLNVADSLDVSIAFFILLACFLTAFVVDGIWLLSGTAFGKTDFFKQHESIIRKLFAASLLVLILIGFLQ